MNRLRNYLVYATDFARFSRKMTSRGRVWSRDYREYLREERENPPFPKIIQIIPTERCNLRCGMCNQWGENGYFITGKRPVNSMPLESLIRFLEDYRKIEPDFLLSIHGGEPFMYREMDGLLDYIHEKKIDTFFSTNGTLIDRYVEKLARINRHTLYLLSIDGGEETHDNIRGQGTLAKVRKGMMELRSFSREVGTGLPKIIINYCVNEHNPEDIDEISKVARELRALVVNYNLRWYLPKEKGEEYDRLLKDEFKVQPTRAWTGWVTNHSFSKIDIALDRVYSKAKAQFWKPRFPFYSILPAGLSLKQAKAFYHDYNELFGIRSCIMPSAWLRIHSNGDLIYCPGHPDIVPGNVFKQDIREIFLNEISRKLRRKVEKNLLPICNRCCGLYMTKEATRFLGQGFVPKKSIS